MIGKVNTAAEQKTRFRWLRLEKEYHENKKYLPQVVHKIDTKWTQVPVDRTEIDRKKTTAFYMRSVSE